MSEQWGIAANVLDDRLFRRGARVLITSLPGDGERVQVRGLSLGGRVITRWIRRAQLERMRPAFLHAETLATPIFGTRDEAAQWLGAAV